MRSCIDHRAGAHHAGSAVSHQACSRQVQASAQAQACQIDAVDVVDGDVLRTGDRQAAEVIAAGQCDVR